MERISIGDIMSKIKTKEDMINFYREQGNKNNKDIGLYFPKYAGFYGKFFLQTLRGEKQVRTFLFNF